MKITEKQLQIMFRVLEGTLSMYDRNDQNLFGYDRETRIRIYNQILNQQSDIVIDTESKTAIEIAIDDIKRHTEKNKRGGNL